MPRGDTVLYFGDEDFEQLIEDEEPVEIWHPDHDEKLVFLPRGESYDGDEDAVNIHRSCWEGRYDELQNETTQYDDIYWPHTKVSVVYTGDKPLNRFVESGMTDDTHLTHETAEDIISIINKLDDEHDKHVLIGVLEASGYDVDTSVTATLVP